MGGKGQGSSQGCMRQRPGQNTEIQFYQQEGSKMHSASDDGLSIQSILLDCNGNTLESEFYKDDTFSIILNTLETCTNMLFSFQNCDLNNFYGEYFGVVNISNYQIHFEELEILGKGIKFCLTPPLYDHGVVKENIDNFFRNANLFLFFSEEDHSQSEIEINSTDGFKHQELKLPSKFNPPKPSMLEHIQEILIDRILTHNPSKARPRNLTKKQYHLLDELQNNNSIVIKKADKRIQYSHYGQRILCERSHEATHRQEILQEV